MQGRYWDSLNLLGAGMRGTGRGPKEEQQPASSPVVGEGSGVIKADPVGRRTENSHSKHLYVF